MSLLLQLQLWTQVTVVKMGKKKKKFKFHLPAPAPKSSELNGKHITVLFPFPSLGELGAHKAEQHQEFLLRSWRS